MPMEDRPEERNELVAHARYTLEHPSEIGSRWCLQLWWIERVDDVKAP